MSGGIKRVLIAGAAVLVLGGAAVGVVAAQAQPTPTTPRAKFEEALANRLHVSVDQLRQAIQGARQDVGATRPARPERPARVGGFGQRGAFGFLGAEAQAVASLLKETPEQLRAELPGNTLADVANKHGVTTDDLVKTIVQTADQHIDQIAKDRNLSADRVSQLKQQISERAQQFVTTHRFPARGSGIRS
jgi:hypothetical protein